MEEDKPIDLISMALIANSGDACSLAFQALAQAKEGKFDKAEDLLQESDRAATIAHETQTQLLFDEANGSKHEINVLLIHAQDHLMRSMLATELIREIILLYKKLR